MENPDVRKLPRKMLWIGYYVVLLFIGAVTFARPEYAVVIVGGVIAPESTEFWRLIGGALAVWSFSRLIREAFWLQDANTVQLQRLNQLEAKLDRIEAKVDQLLEASSSNETSTNLHSKSLQLGEELK